MKFLGESGRDKERERDCLCLPSMYQYREREVTNDYDVPREVEKSSTQGPIKRM